MADQKIYPASQPPSEKKEFLRREEIKTMQKEINRIREEGVQKEREKITSMEIEKEKSSFASTFAKAMADKKASEGREKAKIEESIRIGEQKNMEDAKWKKEPSFAASDAAMEGKEKAAPGNLPAREETPQKPPIEQLRRKVGAPTETSEKITPEASATIGQKSQIEKKLQELSSKIQSLRAKKNQITDEAEKLKLGLAPIYERERIIEVKKKSIEEKESKTAGAEEKRSIEQERWEIEKQREEIEKERWGVEEDIESCQNELKKIDLDWQQIIPEKKEIEKQKEEIEKKEGESKLREEKIRLEKELKTLEDSGPSMEAEKNRRLSQKNKIAGDLQKILENEKSAEETIKQLEQKESLAANPQDKRKIEQERQQMEKQRAGLEKNRWDAEAEDNDASSELKKIESSQGESARRRDAIKNRLKEIDSQISPVKEEIAPEPKIPEKTFERNYPAEKITKIESVERQSLPQKPAQTWIKPEDTGFEEKIATPLSKEETAREIFLERTQELENKKATPLPETTAKDYRQNQESIKPRHLRQSWLEKIWVRFILVVLTGAIIFLVVTFWYWYLGINK